MKLIALLLCVCEGMLTLKEGYDNLQWNKRLEGRFLTIIPRVSPLDCAEECIVRTGCLSFNYLRSAIFCELNYASDLIEDEVLTDSVGWIYGRREHWSMLMTNRCLKSSCRQVEKCIGSLDYNGCSLSRTCTGTKKNIGNREYCYMREHLSWSLAKGLLICGGRVVLITDKKAYGGGTFLADTSTTITILGKLVNLMEE
ncbi:uncharacterized protein [Magallana gigas]|uniref:uncharacterized protein isoform X4 n=1 Tax=Magallana gigas TaxID=29159 RepID=UPI003341F4F6